MAGLQDDIPYPHIAAECMFVLVVLPSHGHGWGSIRVHLLWDHPCFSIYIYTHTDRQKNEEIDRNRSCREFYLILLLEKSRLYLTLHEMILLKVKYICTFFSFCALAFIWPKMHFPYYLIFPNCYFLPWNSAFGSLSSWHSLGCCFYMGSNKVIIFFIWSILTLPTRPPRYINFFEPFWYSWPVIN